MSDFPPPQERFKKVLISLSDLMRKELNKERKRNSNVISEKIVDFGIVLIEESDGKDMIEGFIERSFPKSEKNIYWDFVFEKNKDFFFENSSLIFGELSSGIIDGIATIIKDDNEQNKYLMEGIWKHLFSIVKISINYIYLSRDPKIENIPGEGMVIKYTKDKYSYIPLEDIAKKWGVNLLNAK